MHSLRPAGFLAATLALSVVACGGGDGSRKAIPRDPEDSGAPGSGGSAAGGRGSGGAGTGGAAATGGAPAAGGAPATGGAQSAGGTVSAGGAEADAGPDASTDASDSGAPQADAADAAPDAIEAGADNALFAHIAGLLVSVNTATGELTEIGPTGQEYIVLAWDDAAGVLRAVADVYSPVGGAASPRLGVIDRCTGIITANTALSVGPTALRRVEGLARNPGTGVFSISYGIAGTSSPTQYLSEATGTVDVATGAVTAVGLHQTHQDDGDQLFFIDGELHMLDVASTISQGSVYRVSLVDGQATVRASVGPTVLRVAPDPVRGVVFAVTGNASGTGRGLVALDPDTGARTPVGSIADALYPGQLFTALVSAPAPVCP